MAESNAAIAALPALPPHAGRHLLLDFDGPVCAMIVGAGLPDTLIEILARGSSRLRGLTATGNLRDPLALLRAAAEVGDSELIAEAEAAVVETELLGAAHAPLAPGLADLLTRARVRRDTCSVVSNNSAQAVEAVIARFPDLLRDLSLFCRPSGRPELMKPNPYLVSQAVEQLGARPDECLMIGDSETDVRASLAAGVPIVGYANKPGKRERLSRAGATWVVDSLDDVDLDAFTASGRQG